MLAAVMYALHVSHCRALQDATTHVSQDLRRSHLSAIGLSRSAAPKDRIPLMPRAIQTRHILGEGKGSASHSSENWNGSYLS